MQVLLVGLAGCSHGGGRTRSDVPDAQSTSSHVLAELDRAEDVRRAKDVPARALSDDDPKVRRRAAQALARILDADDAPLLSALSDEDDETVAWAALGLGETCRDQQDTHVRALSARLPSLDPLNRPANPVDGLRSVLRALGRCASITAERTLAAWLAQHRGSADFAEEAVYALGDIAVARGSLVPESVDVLLEASGDSAPLDAALYPFGRADVGLGSSQKERLGRAARAALERPGPFRIFAVRALARLGTSTIADLTGILTGSAYSTVERGESARSLARMELPGIEAIERAFVTLVPASLDSVSPSLVGLLLAVLQEIPAGAANPASAALRKLASLPLADGASPGHLRRASALRCAAASKFATWDSEVIRRCDLGDGVRWKLAQLEVLDRIELRNAARKAWWNFADADHGLSIFEAATAMLGRHPEVSDEAPRILDNALHSLCPGLVSVAAEVLRTHPERAFVPLRRASGGFSRSNTSPGAKEAANRKLSPRVSSALREAMKTWSSGLNEMVDPRASLIDAAVAIGLDGAGAFARSACASSNPSLRSRAARALDALNESSAACRTPVVVDYPAPELGHVLSRPVRVLFETDAGLLAIRFDPTFAPVEVTRLVNLYDLKTSPGGYPVGIVLHRPSPGTIVQLGDQDGDGYPSRNWRVRSEMSPVAFGPFDVGLMLSGRDNASGQLFISWTRAPNLDGRFPWLGHAEGDWDAVVDGDVVHSVRLEP